MISKRQYMILSFFIIRGLFFGQALSLVLGLNGNGAWFSTLVGISLGFLFNLFIQYVNKIKKDKNIVEYLNKPIIGDLGRILLLIMGIELVNQAFLSISVMADNFYLTNTKTIYLVIGLAITIIYIIKKGISSFARVAEMLFPLAIGLFIIKNLGYGRLFEFKNFKPYLDTDKISLFKASMIIFANTILPSILMLNFKTDGSYVKNGLIGYLLGTLMVLSTLVMVIGIFGLPLASAFRYPEYNILKEVSFLNFIKNIENVLTLSWLIDSIVLAVIATFLVESVVKYYKSSEKFIKWWNCFFLLGMSFVCVNIFSQSYNNILILFKYEYLFMLGIGLLLSLIILFHLDRHHQEKNF